MLKFRKGYNMNDRQKHIIFLLDDNKTWFTAKELSEKVGVSDRTIRSDIAKINQTYSKPIILSNRHKGYSLADLKVVQELSLHSKSFSRQDNKIPQTPEDRIAYILKKLLLDDKAVNLYKLIDEMYVSEFSIENDLRRVRQKLLEFPDLQLARSKSHIKLEGSEIEKRKLYKYLLKEETKETFLSLDKLASLFTEIDLLKIKDLLDETLDEFDFHIREMSMPMLMIHIGISIERLMKCNYIQTNVVKEDVKDSIEYKIAYSFFKKVGKQTHIKIIESEILRLTLLIMGKRNNRYRSQDIVLTSSDLPLANIIDDILQRIYEQFNVDLRYDDELKIGLCVHLQGVEERCKQGIEIENIYLQEIKQNYNLVFELAILSANVLKQYTNYEVNEDEVGFIALHLGSAYERSALSDKYRAVMICPEEQVLSKMCYQKISNRFSDKMDIVAQLGVFEEKEVLDYDPDLIISTLPLQHDLLIPSIYISSFVNYSDESKIFYTLYDLDKMKNQKNFEAFIKDMVHPELFYTHMKLSTPNQIIHYMCKDLFKLDFVPEEFETSVLQREQFSSTSIVNGVAIPHAMNGIANRSCISIAFLDKPIQWGKFDVSMVVLLAIKDVDNNLMGIFFDWLTSVVSDTERFCNVLKVKNYEEFINLFE